MNVTSIVIEVVIYDIIRKWTPSLLILLCTRVQVRVAVFSILTVLTILCTHEFCGGMLDEFGVGTKALC